MYIVLAVLVVLFFIGIMVYFHRGLYEHRVVHGSQHYEDRPRLGGGFVLANLVLLFFGLLFGAGLVWRNADVLPMVIICAGLFMVLCAYQLAVLHACYATVYSLYENEIELRSGRLFRTIVPMAHIASISRVQNVRRVLRQGTKSTGRGFCNRWSNGVSFVANGITCSLMPSNPEAFVKVLSNAVEAAREPHKA